MVVSPAALAAPSSSSQEADQPVRFDILDSSAKGVLLPGAKLALSVQLTGKPAAQREELVAVFEADSFPTRLVPLTRNAGPKALSAVVLFEPYPESLLAAKQKAIRIDMMVARRRGMGLEPLLRRRVYVTVGQPAVARQKASISEQRLASKGETDLPQESIHPDLEAVSEESIEEEERLPAPPMIQSRAYWKTVNALISRSWRQEVGQQRKASVRRSPRVQFRLYANGEAQLLQVERSSGDRRTDDAGLQAVINAHPFPPMPPAFPEPHIEVHVDLPGPPQ
jgi:TonB family protein